MILPHHTKLSFLIKRIRSCNTASSPLVIWKFCAYTTSLSSFSIIRTLHALDSAYIYTHTHEQSYPQKEQKRERHVLGPLPFPASP